MAFSKPSECGLGGTLGGITTLTTTLQPVRIYWIESPRQGARDGGIVRHGRDTCVWVIAEGEMRISDADYVTLMGYYNTAKGQRGRIFARTYDEEASSGAGAWANDRYIMDRPRGTLLDADGNRADVVVTLRAKGIPQ